MVEVIAEHSVNLSLLPENAVILDAGCRGFEFTKHLRSLGYQVVPVDIDNLDGIYFKCAIGYKDGRCSVNHTNDPQAKSIKEGNEIDMFTIETIYNNLFFNPGKFDLIKLDIEGEEINVLKHGKHPMSKQLSVEFHAHIGQTKAQIDELLNYLEEYYTITKSWEPRHGAGFNYWDVLMIAK